MGMRFGGRRGRGRRRDEGKGPAKKHALQRNALRFRLASTPSLRPTSDPQRLEAHSQSYEE